MGTVAEGAAMDRLWAQLDGGEGNELLRQAERAGNFGTFVWEAATDRFGISACARAILCLAPDAPVTIEALGDAPRRVRIAWTQVRDAGGALLGASGTLADVGETEDLRAALQESQALWRSVGMNPNDFVTLVDRQGTFIWVNHTAPGIREEDLIGKATLFDLIDVEHHAEVRASLDRCFDLGLPAQWEAYASTLEAWFHSSCGPVVREGRTWLASVLTRNITEARRTLAELGRRERLLAKAQRIAGVGSWQWRAQNGAVEWSAEMYRICGVEPSVPASIELFHKVVHPEDQARILRIWQRAIGKAAVARQEFRIRRVSDGTTRYVLTTGEPTLNAEGDVDGYLGTTLDVTERRELEADLAQSRKLEAVGRLAGGIAHDFNNVLTAILGNAELAAHTVPLDSPAGESLDIIRQAGERASNLTRQLLAFARRQIVAPRVHAPNVLIESVAALFRPLLGDAIQLELVLPTGIGRIRVDVGQFEQLVMNLAVNARDAMPNGGTLRVETQNVTVREGVFPHPEVTPGDYVALIVSDTGVGIPPEVQPHVFEPFFSTKSSGRGTGLGLATCHGIVKQSGGHIWLESSPGAGTRAYAYLPRAASGDVAIDSESAPPVLKPGRETILVVEDEPLVRGLVVRSLRALGYEVLEAATGAAAIAIAGKHTARVDLLFADVMLPDRRGPEVAAAIADAHPETKVLYTSGFTDDSAVTSGVVSASVRLLHKPYTMAALAAAVRAALDEPMGTARLRHSAPPTV